MPQQSFKEQQRTVSTSGGQRWLVIPVILAAILMVTLVVAGSLDESAVPTTIALKPTTTPKPTVQATSTVIAERDDIVIVRSSFGSQRVVEIHAASTGALVRSFADGANFVLSPDQQTLFMVQADHLVAYRTFTGEELWKTAIGDVNVTNMIISKNANRLGIVTYLAAGGSQAHETYSLQWFSPSDGNPRSQYELFDFERRYPPFFSTDGNTIFYVSTGKRLEIANANGNSWFNLPADLLNVAPTLDAKYLYVLAGTDRYRIEIYNLQQQKLDRTVTFPEVFNECTLTTSFHIAADNQTIAMPLRCLSLRPVNHILVYNPISDNRTLLPLDTAATDVVWNTDGSQLSAFTTQNGANYATLYTPAQGFLAHEIKLQEPAQRMWQFALAKRAEPRAPSPFNDDAIISTPQIPYLYFDAPTILPNSTMQTITLDYAYDSQPKPDLQTTTVPTTWLRLDSTSGVRLVALRGAEIVFEEQADQLIERRNLPPLLLSKRDGLWQIKDPLTSISIISMGEESGLRNCLIDPDQRAVACFTTNNEVLITDLASGNISRLPQLRNTNDGNGVLVMWTRQAIYGYSLVGESREIWRINPTASNPIYESLMTLKARDQFAITPDDRMMYTNFEQGKRFLYDMNTQTSLVLSNFTMLDQSGMTIAPNGNFVATVNAIPSGMRDVYLQSLIITDLNNQTQTALNIRNITNYSLQWSDNADWLLWRSHRQFQPEEPERLWLFNRLNNQLLDLPIETFRVINTGVNDQGTAVVSYYSGETPSLLFVQNQQVKSIAMPQFTGQNPAIVWVE